MPTNPSNTASISLALIGSGGAGVMTAGQTLLDAAATSGYFGLMTRSTGPQIRGGEAAAVLRIASWPVECQDDRLDLLVALDWDKAERFAAELTLDAETLVVADPDQGDPPEWISASPARTAQVPFQALTKEVRGSRANTIAVGLVANMIGLAAADIEATVERILGNKGAKLIEAALAGLRIGAGMASELPELAGIVERRDNPEKRWLITGNEAVGMGALRAGVKFCAAYPITPSTEIQEWLAERLPEVGGVLVQAEDELASINMCLGASFGGVPAITATSGPGFSLMVEALGLATATETPVTVVNVMRGGPSTGIPTKSEQADLNVAVYGAHGDAPRLVLAPNGIGDCLTTTQWAVHLSEKLQCPAVVLSDQLLGQARAAIRPPEPRDWQAERVLAEPSSDPYQRYADTDNGVSPMALPGMAGGEHTATGLTHLRSGRPSALVEEHHHGLAKRQRKLQSTDFGEYWADIEGTGDVAVITWGSATQAVREALARLGNEGIAVRLIAIRLISPLDSARLAQALAGVVRVLVVEQSHSGQFYRYLRAHANLPADTRSLARPGPLMLAPGEVAKQIRRLASEEAA